MIIEAATGSRPVDEAVDTARLGAVVAALSRSLDARKIGAGALAELRRITDDDLPPAFWKRYLTDVPPEWREPRGRPDQCVDRAWGRLIRAMVEMAPRPHSFERSFGEALAETGYSEPRFVRLLRAEGHDLAREARVAAAWLAAHADVKANWEQPARLLLGRPWLGLNTRDKAASHGLARGYFRVADRRSRGQ